MISRRLPFMILACIAAVWVATVLGAEIEKKPLLRDGFALPKEGVDGRLIREDSNDAWLFELDSDLSDKIQVVKAGTKLELLPSETLGKITEDAKERSGTDYVIWGRVTKYRGRNFIFPSYFLPLRKPIVAEPVAPEEPEEPNEVPAEPEAPDAADESQGPSINDPNDPLALPEEIIKRIKEKRARKVIRQPVKVIAPPKQAVEKEAAPARVQDSVLIGRTGLVDSSKRSSEGAWQGMRFTLYGLSREMQQRSFELLPCEALERTEQLQAKEPDRLRFKVAGIVTKYKGKDYLLLQRSTQVYSHQNFGR